ncbi:hypothetical protein ACLOJK_013396 [Asimina triloba]
MGSLSAARKPHAVLVPYPAQGHTNPFLKIAKLLHSRGFHITYIHTEYNYKRLLKSKGPDSVKGLKDFRFETIPDGLPPSDADDVTQDIASLALSLRSNCVVPFRDLIKKLNDGSSSGVPSVSCIIADQFMTFTLQVAQELGIIELLFWTTSACGGLCYFHFKDLIQKGYTPLKDSSYLTNGYLDTVMDGIPGLKNMRLWDFPSFLRATAGRYDSDYMLLNYDSEEAQNAPKAWGVFLNTVYDLEREAVDALRLSLPRVYTIGSLSNLVDEIPPNNPSKSFESSLWKEDTECLKWLDTKEAGSVVYVNFGSIAVMTAQQLSEFAWGLANSKCPFLWVIRPDLVRGDSAMVPQDFIDETKDRCLIISWCPQEQVLAHSSVGVFLTHCGWNSTLESISSGVPMICWPFFAEQPTNCRYICNEWRIGMAIDGNVKREQVESLVREMMVGEEGREMKKRVMMWKKSATEATEAGGSSSVDLDKMIGDILQEISQR